MTDGSRSRSCGDCIVCCVYPRIEDPELTKVGMKHCPNLTLPGLEESNRLYYTGESCENCKIYDRRPKMCEAYQCAWRRGLGADGDRPDKVLMLFDNSGLIENALQAKPLREWQEDTPEGREVIERMSKTSGKPVLVVSFYERKLKRVVGKGL